jgi:hypothetical protein
MPEKTDTQALIDAAREGVEPIELHPGSCSTAPETC